MGNIEQCFLATKGHQKRICNNVKQLVIDTRTIHSKKPAQVRSRIVDLMGDLPCIELFSRDKIEGWDCWGNQIPDSEQKLLKTDEVLV
jgi:N6-adenosine-specific RNA methylase IME4